MCFYKVDIDLSSDENIYYDDCYWLSRDYYEDACSFYRRELNVGEIDAGSRGQRSERVRRGIESD